MTRVRFNERSWSAKVENLQEQTEEGLRANLGNIAEQLAIRSPVDTGAFAESYSVVPASSGGGRSRTSRGRPRRQDQTTYQNIALENMLSDIAGIPLLENRSVSFRNRAPHARQVEDKHQIFGVAKDRFR